MYVSSSDGMVRGHYTRDDGRWGRARGAGQEGRIGNRITVSGRGYF